MLGCLSEIPLPHAAAGCFNILINSGQFAPRAVQPDARCTLEPGGRHRMLGCRLPREPRDMLRANKPLRRLLSPKLSPVFSAPRANSTTNTHVSADRALLGGAGGCAWSMGCQGVNFCWDGLKWVGGMCKAGLDIRVGRLEKFKVPSKPFYSPEVRASLVLMQGVKQRPAAFSGTWGMRAARGGFPLPPHQP